MLDEGKNRRKTSSSSQTSASSGNSLVSGGSTPVTRLLPPPIPGRTGSFKGRASPSPNRNFLAPIDTDRLIRRSSLPSSSPNLLSVSTSDNDIRDRELKDRPIRRVRSFKTTSKGAVVNRGDSFRTKTPAEDANLFTPGEQQSLEKINSSHGNISHKNQIIPEPLPSSYFKVLMLGSSGVGKSALTTQFLTSEYIGAFDTVNGECFTITSVTCRIYRVLLLSIIIASKALYATPHIVQKCLLYLTYLSTHLPETRGWPNWLAPLTPLVL